MKNDQPMTFEELKRLLDERKRYQEAQEACDKYLEKLHKDLAKETEAHKYNVAMLAKLEDQIRAVGKAV